MDSDVKDRLFEIISDLPEEKQKDLLRTLEKRRRPDERRRHPRKPYSVSVDYVSTQGSGRILLQDVSVGGVQLLLKDFKIPFSPGDEILLHIPYPNSRKFIRKTGQVVRVTDKGIGVAFKGKHF